MKDIQLSVNLKKFRELNRYSQEMIAKYLEITRQTYSLYEKDPTKISAYDLYMLSQKYQWNSADFFDKENLTICENEGD